jgi:hypothetical protein
VPNQLERGRQNRAAQVEDGEQSTHDRGGASDDDAGHDSHFTVCVTLADGIGAAPDFDDAPKESEDEQNSERRTESLLQLGGAARGLCEDRG